MLPRTEKWGITGGIGSGKSYICRMLEARGFPVFYCDEMAKKLMAEDSFVREQLITVVGKDLYAPDGKLVKSVMSQFLRSGKTCAERVNQIVHPAVGRKLDFWFSEQTSAHAFVEAALLFEAGYEKRVDHTVFVDAPQELRIERVMGRDGASREQVLSWIDLQWPDDEKRKKADYVLYNDGEHSLDEQLDRLFLR